VVPKKAWLGLSAIGILVGVVIALVPITVHFGGDPLLRLRDLDPELSPPAATAECGSPASALDTTPRGTSLYELARASACQDAGRRRLAVAIATGAGIVMLGLVGAASVGRVDRGSLRPSKTPPAPVPFDQEGTIGKQPEQRAAAGRSREGQ
jgi:hypothetical protein